MWQVVFADLADYVNPFVGTAGTGHTSPAACVPFGLVQAGPDTGYGDWAHCSGYIYGDTSICGFTQTHLSGTGCPDLGDLRILPFRGEAAERVPFEHADEEAKPGYYAVVLRTIFVKVEIAATAHAAIYRITSDMDGELGLLVEPKSIFYNPPEFPKIERRSLAHAVKRDEEGVVGLSGAYHTKCWVERDVGYAVAFSRPGRVAGDDVYAFNLKRGEALFVKIGLSAGGRVNGVADHQERSRSNLSSEIPDWNFGLVKTSARSSWNRMLASAVIDGTDDQKRNWYTSLYHLCVHPNNIADVGESPLYSTFSCWDTFRAAAPLYTILFPEYAASFVDSLLEQGRRTGFLPIWTLWGRDNQCMIGTHSVPMIVDWFLKEGGENSWSWRKDMPIPFSNSNSKLQLDPPTQNSNSYWLAAYTQIKDTLTKPHEGRFKERWDLLDKYGYYPFDEIMGEGVSRTMECAYDDWCAGVMAEKLGFAEDAAFFLKRSQGWRNVFDQSIGFVRGRDSKGAWRTPYDPYALGHGASKDNDFTEGNAFQYSWHVMQDPEGLIAAMGGRNAFVRKLDSLFTAPSKTDGMGEVLDVTGLIGQYVHGNEPSHHVIYFYPQVGYPDKAAERIREVFDKFYLPKPDGLCGNDDCGQMSAWYLFSTMGFYPFNPCGGEYVLGAPQVPKVTIKLERKVGGTQNSNSFTITAKNLSRENKYVKSVTLNGKLITDWKIRHSDILSGGELVFEMSNRFSR